jgi:hypothetical protein
MQFLVRHKILVFALVTAVVTDAGLLVVLWPQGFGADFTVYWRAANSSAPYAAHFMPFANPPTALLWLQILRPFGETASYVVFGIAGLVAYLWSGQRLYGRPAAFLALLSPALLLAAIPGQLAIIEAALVFFAFASPPIASGILLAVAGSLKPQIVLLAPISLYVLHGPKALLAFIVAALLLFGAATLAFGVDIWSEWFAGMGSLVNVAAERHALLLAVSPLSFAGSLHPIVILIACAIAVAGAAAIYVSRNLPAADQAAVLVACSLFASPYALSYDMVALTPFAAALLLRDRSWRAACGAVTFTAAFGPFNLLATLFAARPAGMAKSAQPSERSAP